MITSSVFQLALQRAVRRGDSLVGAWCVFTAIIFTTIQGPATINPILIMLRTFDKAIFIKFIVIVTIGMEKNTQFPFSFFKSLIFQIF